MIVIPRQSNQLDPRSYELSYHCMTLVTGKTEVGSQLWSEAPHPPIKKKQSSQPTEGGKSKHKAMRKGSTVYSLQEKRLSRRQKKERNLIQPPASTDILFLSYPLVAGLLARGVLELKR